MRPIDGDKLLEDIEKERQYLRSRGLYGAEHILVHNFRNLVEDAQTIPSPDFKEGYKQAILDGKTNYQRPQGEWNITNETDEFYGRVYKCTHCGEEMLACGCRNFCTWCGAKMKGGAE